MKKTNMELRQSITETFYIVFTYSEDEGSFVHEDFCEEVFVNAELAEEYAQANTEEDGIPRIVVRCEPVSAVTIPKPVVRINPIKVVKK